MFSFQFSLKQLEHYRQWKFDSFESLDCFIAQHLQAKLKRRVFFVDSYFKGMNKGGGTYLVCTPSVQDGIFIKQINTSLQLRLINKEVTPFHFGAVGDGVNDDTNAIKKAIVSKSSQLNLHLGTDLSSRFLISDSLLFKNADFVSIRGHGTIIRKGSSIDGKRAFYALIKIENCKDIVLEGNWSIDGNRDKQSYKNIKKIGIGKYFLRHNGDIFISCYSKKPDEQNIYIKINEIKNSFLNGIVLWNTNNTTVLSTKFKNTTWNGISGAGLTSLSIHNCRFTMCGGSKNLSTNLIQGDRAGVQVRELPKYFSFKSEGMTVDGNGKEQGKINLNIKISMNSFISCGVQSIYLRAGFDCHIEKNYSVNCGYLRLHKENRYRPAHIWLESGEYNVRSNLIVQRRHNPSTGWMMPDGIRITTLNGDATKYFPATGICKSFLSGNSICSLDKMNRALFYNGLRTNGNCTVTNLLVKGTLHTAVWLINSASFEGETVVRDFQLLNSAFYAIAQESRFPKAIVYVSRFGKVSGHPENIEISRISKASNLNDIKFNNNLRLNGSYGI
ncbi:hypothetical protein [Alteromonas sp. D210916BOD_24]|uniref:hypothetical protein n=1 Tax=Alteromonas sp. D210916BOD_24 TaxID=3157618 RepID=UPI00399D1478